MAPRIKQTLLAITACFLWSTAFVGIKKGLPYTTPVNFAGVRFMLAGIITLLLMKNKRENIRAIFDHFPIVLKVGILQTFLLYLMFYLGLSRISGALGAVVTGFSPLWSIVLAHFFMKNDRLTPRKIISFLLGLTGIFTVAYGRGKGMGEVSTVGLLLMLGASLASGVSAILVAKDKGKLPPMALNGAQLFLGGVVLTLCSFIFEPVRFPTEPQYFISLFYLAGLSAAAFSIWFHLLKGGAKISSLNLWKFIIPVSGAILSWIILPNESPTLIAVGGMALVGAAIYIYYGFRLKE